MKDPVSSDNLSRTLAAWQVKPPPSPGFRPEVWQRIQRRARTTWAGYIRAHCVGWSVVAGLAVAAAGWTGHTVAEAKLDLKREQMVISYLGDLDPRVMANLRP